ncbi:MAG TPA: Ig domain-containing protein, partial [Bryobacteraceae bacterium]|nr:Ig domain-containing protein [Bryobacteraceae bacterium]
MRFDRSLLRLCWIVIALIGPAGALIAQPLPISLFPAPPPGPPVPLQDGVLNQAYNGGIFEINFIGPTAWSITSGSLPPGITATAIRGTYNFTGSPKSPGLFVFTVQAVDSGAGPQTTSQQYSINIELPLTITTPLTLPDATAGYNYSEAFTAVNGTPPYSWNEGPPPGLTYGKTSAQRAVTISQRGLPAGLTLSSNGALTGAPTQAGAYSLVISAVDSGIQSTTSAFAFVVNPPPSVPAATLPNGVTGTVYSAPLTAQNGTTPYFWTVNSGVLPPGLTILPAGMLSGTPTKAGTYLFGAQVTDAHGAPAVGAMTVTITQGLAITTASPLPNGAVGSAYTLQFAG